jgi:hypothetical protein
MKIGNNYMLLKTAVLTVATFCLVSISAVCAQEEIVLSTYYPAPYGEYDGLTANELSVGEKAHFRGYANASSFTSVSAGDIYYNTTDDEFKYTPDGTNWYDMSEGSGRRWILSGTELNTVNNVRVGTVTGSDPSVNLGVEGQRLYFSGADADGMHTDSENSDWLWIQRYNAAWDKTELRVRIGDNVNGLQPIETSLL